MTLMQHEQPQALLFTAERPNICALLQIFQSRPVGRFWPPGLTFETVERLRCLALKGRTLFFYVGLEVKCKIEFILANSPHTVIAI